MADPKSQQDAQAEAGTVEATEFDSLLRKEFKPKTDEAKEAVEPDSDVPGARQAAGLERFSRSAR